MKIDMISVLNDNYIFVLIDEKNQKAAVVDPAVSEPVLNYLEKEKLILTKIFNTHHHYDHVGGNKELVKAFKDVEVYAGINDAGRIPYQTHYLKHGDFVTFAGETAYVYYVPGHTFAHICYFFSLNNGESHLFIGDTIFAGGCGKLFEGTMYQMFSSLKFLRNNLPDQTYIWCAHEYTLENYMILQLLEPNNIEIKRIIDQTTHIRQLNRFTVPTTLGREKISNSFLRWDDQALKVQLNTISDFETFSYVRKYRDMPHKVHLPI